MNNIIKILAGAVLVLSFASCLKDDKFDDHIYGHTGLTPIKTIELRSSETEVHSNIISLDFKDSDIVVSTYLNVHLNSVDVAPEDITVTLDTAVSAALIVGYDTTNGTSLVPFTPDMFSFVSPGLQVVIPAGSRDGYVQINTNTIHFDPSSTYALGFHIASIDKPGYTISNNFGDYLVLIGAKNDYDGVYELHSQFYHPTSAPGFPLFSSTVEMWTTGANSVKMFDPVYFGDFIHPWSTGSAITGFAAQSPQYTIDPVTKKITVDNAYPGATVFYAMGLGFDNAGYDSRYDEATRTMYVNFGYNMGPNGEFLPGGANGSREWIDTLIYTGPR